MMSDIHSDLFDVIYIQYNEGLHRQKGFRCGHLCFVSSGCRQSCDLVHVKFLKISSRNGELKKNVSSLCPDVELGHILTMPLCGKSLIPFFHLESAYATSTKDKMVRQPSRVSQSCRGRRGFDVNVVGTPMCNYGGFYTLYIVSVSTCLGA